MTDVFISYSRNDREKVRIIAEALEREGFGVWWDPEIPPGESFSKVIDRQLKEARCIIAVWSSSSIHSNWVQEEADDGQMRNALVPVMIDDVDLPRGFKRLQTADLRGWRGDKNDPNWQLIISQVRKLVSARAADIAAERQAASRKSAPKSSPRPSPAQSHVSAPQKSGGGSPVLPILLFLLLLIGGGAGYWFLMGPGAGEKTELALPKDPNASDTEQVAGTPVIESEADDDAAGSTPKALEDSASRAAPVKAETAEAPAVKPAASAVQQGERFRDCADCPEMIIVARGGETFTMGAADGEYGHEKSELPRVGVKIAKGYAIGVYEVTFDQWRACLADGGCNGYEPPSMGWGEGDRPVVNINYADAKAFVAWLSNKTGKSYRIPSEAEWEYAAKAGGVSPFATGELITTSQANFNGKEPYSTMEPGSYRRKTVEVGSFRPNAFGLYDIHGNVWEWTADCWRQSHSGAPTDGSPVGGSCSNGVIKGGAWISGAWRLRSSHRRKLGQDERKFDQGLRVVRDL